MVISVEHTRTISGVRAAATLARSCGAPCGGTPLASRPPAGGRPSLPRQSFVRRHRAALALERAAHRTGAAGWTRRSTVRSGPTGRARAPLRGRLRTRRRTPELDAGPPCLRQADSDGLLRGSRAVLPFSNVMHFLADEFAGLRRGRLAGRLVSPSSL